MKDCLNGIFPLVGMLLRGTVLLTCLFKEFIMKLIFIILIKRDRAPHRSEPNREPKQIKIETYFLDFFKAMKKAFEDQPNAPASHHPWNL